MDNLSNASDKVGNALNDGFSGVMDGMASVSRPKQTAD
jgi:hypothetical protein